MKSIRLRLMVVAVVVTTATLAAFGLYGRFELSGNLEQHFSQLTQATMTRLGASAAGPLANLDPVGVDRILEVEMLTPEVNAIEVFDSRMGLFASALRGAQGQIETGRRAGEIKGVRAEAALYHDDRPATGTPGTQIPDLAGTVVVYFSRDPMEQALRADALRRVIEALVVDALLVLALTLCLGTFFKPLRQLRDGLFELAKQGGDEARELPQSEHTELAEVIQGFNLTQRKLRSVMVRRARAKESARTAASQTEQAYADLLATQQSLIQAEKLASLGGLVAGVAHEINTPVGIALTSASVLRDATEQLRSAIAQGPVSKSEVMSYMELAAQSTRLIMSNTERAAHLIQSFKEVSVDETSERRRTYELKDYIDEVMSSLHPMLKRARTVVRVQCPQSIVLDGYPGAMAQVLTNLTMNSLKHAFEPEQDGQIRIVVEVSGDRVCLSFADDGRGISPEHIDKVFDPFFTTGRGHGGTGLGLNIVYNIMVKQFGGTIFVRSEPGNGACFLLRFPRISPTAV